MILSSFSPRMVHPRKAVLQFKFMRLEIYITSSAKSTEKTDLGNWMKPKDEQAGTP